MTAVANMDVRPLKRRALTVSELGILLGRRRHLLLILVTMILVKSESESESEKK